MAYSDVRSQYKPIRPAFMGAVATAAVLFVLGKFIGSKDVGYDKLYNLGLALPARLTDSGLQLGDYVVVSGSAFLAWLGLIMIGFGATYAIYGAIHEDPYLNSEMEHQQERIRDAERHQADLMGRAQGQQQQQPMGHDPMMGQPGFQQPPGMGYPPQAGYAGNYPPPQAMGQ